MTRGYLSRKMIYGDCIECGKECVGDSTREIFQVIKNELHPEGQEEVFLGFAHPECDPTNGSE